MNDRQAPQPAPTGDAEKLALITQIVETFAENAEDPEGDKFTSKPDLCIQAIEWVLYEQDGALASLARDGWIDPAGAPA